jgi:hypothetical protein
MPSESIAELPVIAAATNFVTAMSVFPMRAAMMTFLDDDAMDTLNEKELNVERMRAL